MSWFTSVALLILLIILSPAILLLGLYAVMVVLGVITYILFLPIIIIEDIRDKKIRKGGRINERE